MKKEPAPKRGFKGLFIPRNIYLSSELKPMEKMLLGEIDALDDPESGCYASNAHFSDFLGVSERYVRKMISHLEHLGLVRVDGGYGRGCTRVIRIDTENISNFNKPKKQAKKRNYSSGKRGTTVPKKRNYSSSEVEHVEYNRGSTTVERREEGREPGGSASSFDSGQGRGNSQGATESLRDGLFIAGATTGTTKTAQTATKTPAGAPWSGTKYNGITRDMLKSVESYDEIWALQGDPIWAAMCVTGEIFRGGYGFWIKWLNSAVLSFGSIESAVSVFMDLLVETWGEVSVDGIRNSAAVFNNKLKKVMEAAA